MGNDPLKTLWSPPCRNSHPIAIGDQRTFRTLPNPARSQPQMPLAADEWTSGSRKREGLPIMMREYRPDRPESHYFMLFPLRSIPHKLEACG
jgi:hypothetical protein